VPRGKRLAHLPLNTPLEIAVDEIRSTTFDSSSRDVWDGEVMATLSKLICCETREWVCLQTGNR